MDVGEVVDVFSVVEEEVVVEEAVELVVEQVEAVVVDENTHKPLQAVASHAVVFHSTAWQAFAINHTINSS